MRRQRTCSVLVILTGLAPWGRAAGQTVDGKKKTASDTLIAPPPAVDIATLRLGRHTVVASPGQTYPAGQVHRFFLGDLNRDLWSLEFPVPVLDLDSVGGGLAVEELSGGKQTLGLRLRGEDGRIYQFRSIVKTPSRGIPSVLRSTAGDVAEDQMAAQFPLSAMVVAELLEAAGVLVAKPRPVVMPDDPRLGEYREAFAGRMGWIEIRPDEREDEGGEEYPGFAGSAKITGTDELFEELYDDPESYVDARQLLRSRLIDMLVGDWDRHADQWRWASYPDGQRTRWEPIPRDRDFALCRIDGLLPSLVGVYRPSYTGFGPEPPAPLDMHWSAQRLDRRLLSGLEGTDFVATARELQNAFSDEVIDRAVGVLPESYQDVVGQELRRDLRQRRDSLVEVAQGFYELLAGWVDVHGTEEVDSVALTPAEGGVRIRMWAPREGNFVRYDRVLHPSETEDVRIYLWEGDDRVVVDGPVSVPVHLVTGEGDDRVVDRSDGRNLRVYDDQGDNDLRLGPDAFRTGSEYLRQDSLRVAYLSWQVRDWGSAWVPRPEVWYQSDIGPYAGFGLARYGYGFGHEPHESKLSLSVLNGFDPTQWIVNLEADRALGPRGWRAVGKAEARTDEPVWLFGFGNDVPAPGDKNDFRSFRSQLDVQVGLGYQAWPHWSVRVGPELTLADAVQPGGAVLDTVDAYGAGRFDQLGLGASFQLDTRDSDQYPRSGRRWRLEARVVPSLLDVEDTFGGLTGELRQYLSADVAGDPALHLRLRAEKAWGRAPFFELPYLGGSRALPGFVRRRFVGDAAASITALARVKLFEPRLVTDLQLGVHAIGSVGRVWWPDDDASTTWHVGKGGGLWLRLPSIDRTVSVSLVSGDQGVRAYLDFGFLF